MVGAQCEGMIGAQGDDVGDLDHGDGTGAMAFQTERKNEKGMDGGAT
jgi:hypothetical protein